MVEQREKTLTGKTYCRKSSCSLEREEMQVSFFLPERLREKGFVVLMCTMHKAWSWGKSADTAELQPRVLLRPITHWDTRKFIGSGRPNSSV